jgi:hypothetical protein
MRLFSFFFCVCLFVCDSLERKRMQDKPGTDPTTSFWLEQLPLEIRQKVQDTPPSQLLDSKDYDVVIVGN